MLCARHGLEMTCVRYCSSDAALLAYLWTAIIIGSFLRFEGVGIVGSLYICFSCSDFKRHRSRTSVRLSHCGFPGLPLWLCSTSELRPQLVTPIQFKSRRNSLVKTTTKQNPTLLQRHLHNEKMAKSLVRLLLGTSFSRLRGAADWRWSDSLKRCDGSTLLNKNLSKSKIQFSAIDSLITSAPNTPKGVVNTWCNLLQDVLALFFFLLLLLLFFQKAFSEGILFIDPDPPVHPSSHSLNRLSIMCLVRQHTGTFFF